MTPCRGIIIEYVTDVEGAEKCLHVPATSLEALSANRRRCWDMEALFCDFHASDVGIWVIWSGHGCRLGCVGCVCMPTLPTQVLLPERESNKEIGSQTLRVYTNSNMSLRITPSPRGWHWETSCGGATRVLSSRKPGTRSSQKRKYQGSQTPQRHSQHVFCCLDRYSAAPAA